MIKCSDCFKKCNGECCAWVPISMKFINKHKDKIQRNILSVEPYRIINGKYNVVYPIVEYSGYTADGQPIVNREKQKCIFLDSNNRCVVYNDRPEICKLFGTTIEPDNSLTCHYHIGRNYSFPKEGTIEKLLIDKSVESGKYTAQLMSNKKFIKELMGEL